MSPFSLHVASKWVLERLPLVAGGAILTVLIAHQLWAGLGPKGESVHANLPDAVGEEIAARVRDGHSSMPDRSRLTLENPARLKIEQEAEQKAREAEREAAEMREPAAPAREAAPEKRRPVRTAERTSSSSNANARPVERKEQGGAPSLSAANAGEPLEIVQPPAPVERTVLGSVRDFGSRVYGTTKRVTVDTIKEVPGYVTRMPSAVANAGEKAWEKTNDAAASVRDFVKRVF